MKATILPHVEDSKLAALGRVAEAAGSTQPLAAMLRQAVGFVSATLACTTCMIYVVEGSSLVLRASTNTDPEVLSRLSIKLDEETARWALGHQTAVVIPASAYKDPKSSAFSMRFESRCEAFLMVPMISGGRLVGVVTAHDRTEHCFGQQQIEAIETAAFLIGTRLETARLAEENARIEQKLKDRTVFENAKKILQTRLALSEEDAYLTLQRESKRRRKPMNEIAEAIVVTEGLNIGGGAIRDDASAQTAPRPAN